MEFDLSMCSESWLEQLATMPGAPADLRGAAFEELCDRNEEDVMRVGEPLVREGDDLSEPATLDRVNAGLRDLAAWVTRDMAEAESLSDVALRRGVEDGESASRGSARYAHAAACEHELERRQGASGAWLERREVVA